MRMHSYYIRTKRGGYGIGPRPDTCAECGAHFGPQPAGSISTGYGCEPAGTLDAAAYERETGDQAPALKAGELIERVRAVCFDCCGRADLAQMRATGRGCMYLTRASDDTNGPRGIGSRATHKVSNWPGTLSVPAGAVRESRGGGFGARRRDTWFCLPGDPFLWHGVNRGDNDILRCRRTKERA